MVTKTSSLVDPNGKPLTYEGLDKEIATPTLGGVRQVLSGHPAQGMDPYRLGAIMRNAEQGDPTAYYELAEEVEEKYLHYQGVLGTRKRAVSQLPITVTAADKDERSQKDAELLRKLFKRPAVRRSMFDILDAIGKGFSVQEIVWDRSRIPWLPKKVVWKSQAWFEFDQVDRETLRLKGGEDNTSHLPTDLPAYKFLIHRHKAKSGETVRGGLMRGVAWAWLFQNFSIKDWVIFAEVYGMPMRVGKYDPTATEADRRKLLQAVVGIGTDAAGIIPRSMEIEFVNAMASGNAEVFERLAVFLDQQVSKAVLGQTGTTDATTGGFGSSGQVHGEVREDIKRADAETLADTLSEMGQWCIDLNHGPPPSGEYPEVNVGDEEFFSKEDMEKVEKFVGMGGKVKKRYVGGRLGVPDDDDTAGEDADGYLQPAGSAPAQSAPNGQDSPPGGVDNAADPTLPPKSPLSGFKRPLNPGGSPSALAAGDAGQKDAIDGLVDAAGDEWVEVMAPMLDPIFEMVDGASSIEEIRASLIGALEKMDASQMTDLVARAGYSARLAGEADADIRGGQS